MCPTLVCRFTRICIPSSCFLTFYRRDRSLLQFLNLKFFVLLVCLLFIVGIKCSTHYYAINCVGGRYFPPTGMYILAITVAHNNLNQLRNKIFILWKTMHNIFIHVVIAWADDYLLLRSFSA